MGPTWVLSAPDGPHVGPMNLAIWDMMDSILKAAFVFIHGMYLYLHSAYKILLNNFKVVINNMVGTFDHKMQMYIFSYG